MRSSYIDNNFGEILSQYIIAWKPSPPWVELGVLDGYSTLHIAKGIKEAKRLYGLEGKLDSYDLFEEYPYKHGSQEEVQKMLEENGVAEYVNLQKGNAYEVHNNYPNRGDGVRGIEFLHVDISNTGQVVHDIMELWHPKIAHRGIVIFEGGSDERDEVEWMKKYNLPSLKKEFETNPIINDNYMIGTYFKYPSMTVMIRMWD